MNTLQSYEADTFSDVETEITQAVSEEVTTEMPAVTQLISERELTHGNYADTARTAQRLKDVIRIEIYRRSSRKQKNLTPTQIESLELIMTKVARIIAGNPDVEEHWLDIAGYAKIARPDA